jgi:hypothetical protein
MTRVLAAVLSLALLVGPVFAGKNSTTAAKKAAKRKRLAVPGEMAVRFHREATETEIRHILDSLGPSERSKLDPDWYLVKVANGFSVDENIARLKREGAVRTAEARYRYYFGTDEKKPVKPKPKHSPVPTPSGTPIKSPGKISKF